MTQGAPMCVVCRRLLRDAAGPACEAFPRGIPSRIATGGSDHRRPFRGDRGLRFDPDPAAAPDLVAAILELYATDHQDTGATDSR